MNDLDLIFRKVLCSNTRDKPSTETQDPRIQDSGYTSENILTLVRLSNTKSIESIHATGPITILFQNLSL